MFINGERVPARSGRTFAAIDPATALAFGTVADGDREDVELAIAVAAQAAVTANGASSSCFARMNI
jgi:acyl-CoA reductase-like NAD-dependent aldehyde dehydrogenase